MPHLLLQLKDAIHKRLAGGRAAGDVNIHRHNPIAAPRNTVTIMIISPSIGTGAHADHPPRVRHLIVHLAQRRSHFVCERAGDDHHVGLPGGSTEDYTQSILVVARGGEVHHLDGAAGEAESHGPEGGLAGPVCYLVEGCSVGVEN